MEYIQVVRAQSFSKDFQTFQTLSKDWHLDALPWLTVYCELMLLHTNGVPAKTTIATHPFISPDHGRSPIITSSKTIAKHSHINWPRHIAHSPLQLFSAPDESSAPPPSSVWHTLIRYFFQAIRLPFILFSRHTPYIAYHGRTHHCLHPSLSTHTVWCSAALHLTVYWHCDVQLHCASLSWHWKSLCDYIIAVSVRPCQKVKVFC